MNTVERWFHRLLRGHWPVYKFVPISDYTSWRVCATCREKRSA